MDQFADVSTVQHDLRFVIKEQETKRILAVPQLSISPSYCVYAKLKCILARSPSFCLLFKFTLASSASAISSAL